MAHVNGPWIELNATELRAFHEQMRHPDRETARRRDAFLEEIHRNPWRENSDGSYEFEFELKPVMAQEIYSEVFNTIMHQDLVHFEDNAYFGEAEVDETYNYAA